ncbi:MAG: Uma2 family endonuclease [Pirellulaceae bacterium]
MSPTGLYTYPDVVVARDNPKFEDEHVDTLLNPTMIVEVFSESTAEFDRGAKFVHYRGIESLCEYVLIAGQTPCGTFHSAIGQHLAFVGDE